MKTTHARTSRIRPGRLAVESLESREVPSGIPSAGAFNALDDLNLHRLESRQTIDSQRNQGDSALAQLISSGQSQTQAILSDLSDAKANLAADRAAGDFEAVAVDRQQIAADRVALGQVRRLVKVGAAQNSRANHSLLKLESNLNTIVVRAQAALARGDDPQTVEDVAGSYLDQVVTNGQNLADTTSANLANLDDQVLSITPGIPVTPITGVNQGRFVGTLHHQGTALDANGNPTPVEGNLTSPFEFVNLFLDGNSINGGIEITTFQVLDANGNVVQTLDTVPGQSSITGTVQATSGTNVPASGRLTAVFPGVSPITVGWQGTVNFDANGVINHVQATLYNLTNTTPSGVPVLSQQFGDFTVDRVNS